MMHRCLGHRQQLQQWLLPRGRRPQVGEVQVEVLAPVQGEAWV